MTTSLQVDYQFQSETFSEAWKMGIASNKTAKIAMNEMVRILLEEHQEWSIREALMTICAEHEDLEGLSVSSMYRHLSAENKRMLQNKDESGDKPETPKTGTEDNSGEESKEEHKNWNEEVQDLIEKKVPVSESTDPKWQNDPEVNRPLEGVINDPTTEEPTELELAKIRIAQLEDALHKTEQFKPVTQFQEDDINSVKVRAGIGAIENLMRLEIPKLKNRGWKTVEITMRAV